MIFSYFIKIQQYDMSCIDFIQLIGLRFPKIVVSIKWWKAYGGRLCVYVIVGANAYRFVGPRALRPRRATSRPRESWLHRIASRRAEPSRVRALYFIIRPATLHICSCFANLSYMVKNKRTTLLMERQFFIMLFYAFIYLF